MEREYLYRFGKFTLDTEQNVLAAEGKTVAITPTTLQLLRVLVLNHGLIVEKDRLMSEVWADRFVQESNLTFTIRKLRMALGDDAQAPIFIETISRRGYRFIAPVERGYEGDSEPPPPVSTSVVKSHPIRLFFAIFAVVILLGIAALGYWFLLTDAEVEDATVPVAPHLTIEKLSRTGRVFSAAITPDGKSVIYTNKGDGKESVWLRDLASGNNIQVIPPYDGLYYVFAFSPDGSVMYFIRKGNAVQGSGEIYRSSILGGVPTKIVGEVQGWMSVSPDGNKVSFVRCYRRDDEYCSLWTADAANGGNEQKLVTRPRPIRIADNRISPDGKSIAFAHGQSENAANEFSLSEIDIASGAEREISKEKFFNIKNIAWLPDQSDLLVTASRIPNRNFRIWKLSKAGGEATPVTTDSESYSVLSLDTRARSIVSTTIRSDFRLSLYSVENPVAGGRFIVEAESAAFASSNEIVVSSSMSGNHEIWRVRSDGEGQRQLTNDIADDVAPVMSYDREKVFFASNRSGEMHVWAMNKDGSNQTQLTRIDGGMPLAVSPDSRWVYYHHGKERTLWRVAVDGADEQVAFDSSKPRFALSADGVHIAYAEVRGERKVLVIRALGAEKTDAEELIDCGDLSVRITDIVWLPDGKSVAYVLADDAYKNQRLWLQPRSGGSPRQVLSLGDEEVADFSFSPDGRTVAVSQGDWKHDAVLMRAIEQKMGSGLLFCDFCAYASLTWKTMSLNWPSDHSLAFAASYLRLTFEVPNAEDRAMRW